MDVPAFLDARSAEVGRALSARLRRIPHAHPGLLKAMLYSLEAGGKRLRPALVGAAYELFGGDRREAMPAACALEMVHTYSLIHDDLPAMDDDDLRRGRPTNHKVFGEAAAILAGDALLTNAFSELASAGEVRRIGPARALKAVSVLAQRAGAGGMVGGQSADLEAEGFTKKRISRAAALRRGRRLLDYIHRRKTADLLQASVEVGAALGGASPAQLKALSDYAYHLGIGFQITDDILDVVGDKKKLGKSGSDARNAKLTYVTLYGLERSRGEAARHIAAALRRLAALKVPRPARKAPLAALAEFILARDK